MKVAVFGTGNVGDTIGSKLIEVGHTVMMGSRTSDNENAKAFVAKHHGKATAGIYADAAAFGEIIFIDQVEILVISGKRGDGGDAILEVCPTLKFPKGTRKVPLY